MGLSERRHLDRIALGQQRLSVDYQLRRDDALFHLLRRIIERIDNMGVDLSGLQSAIAAEDTEIATLTTDVENSFSALEAQVANLTAGEITQDQIDALTAAVTTHQSALASLDAAASAANPTPAPAPADTSTPSA